MKKQGFSTGKSLSNRLMPPSSKLNFPTALGIANQVEDSMGWWRYSECSRRCGCGWTTDCTGPLGDLVGFFQDGPGVGPTKNPPCSWKEIPKFQTIMFRVHVSFWEYWWESSGTFTLQKILRKWGEIWSHTNSLEISDSHRCFHPPAAGILADSLKVFSLLLLLVTIDYIISKIPSFHPI